MSGSEEDLNAQFMEGYRLLGRYNLSFDNYSPDHGRLPTLAKLANACPDVHIIVNHLGGRVDPAADSAAFAQC